MLITIFSPWIWNDLLHTSKVQLSVQRSVFVKIVFICVQTKKRIKTILKRAANKQQQKLLGQKKATLHYSSKTKKHAGFFQSFYTESYLVQTDTTQSSPSISYTVAIEKHEPCGYAIAGIEHGKATPVYFELKRGDNCLDEFVKSLNLLASDIYNQKRAFYGPFLRPVLARENYTIYGICENEINDEAELVLDPCHYDGHFLGCAHQLVTLVAEHLNLRQWLVTISKSMMFIIYVSH